MPHETDLFFEYLKTECGYKEIRKVNDQFYVAIYPFLYTHAIIFGRLGDTTSYLNRWCYHTFDKALAALDRWKEVGYGHEPNDWHRHPTTGRRVNENGEMEVYF